MAVGEKNIIGWIEGHPGYSSQETGVLATNIMSAYVDTSNTRTWIVFEDFTLFNAAILDGLRNGVHGTKGKVYEAELSINNGATRDSDQVIFRGSTCKILKEFILPDHIMRKK